MEPSDTQTNRTRYIQKDCYYRNYIKKCIRNTDRRFRSAKYDPCNTSQKPQNYDNYYHIKRAEEKPYAINPTPKHDLSLYSLLSSRFTLSVTFDGPSFMLSYDELSGCLFIRIWFWK